MEPRNRRGGREAGLVAGAKVRPKQPGAQPGPREPRGPAAPPLAAARGAGELGGARGPRRGGPPAGGGWRGKKEASVAGGGAGRAERGASSPAWQRWPPRGPGAPRRPRLSEQLRSRWRAAALPRQKGARRESSSLAQKVKSAGRRGRAAPAASSPSGAAEARAAAGAKRGRAAKWRQARCAGCAPRHERASKRRRPLSWLRLRGGRGGASERARPSRGALAQACFAKRPAARRSRCF